MVQNSKENIIKLLNKLIEQDTFLLVHDEDNSSDYVKEIQVYRFIINLLKNEKYFSLMAENYGLDFEK